MNRILLFILLAGMSIHKPAEGKYHSVLDYRADGSGRTLSTNAIQSAIDDCAHLGGGTVWFPAGRYLSGTIFLKSFVTLHFENGAVLEGSKNLEDYPVTIPQIRSYTDNYTCRSLIYGEDLQGIGITGQGVVDGNGGFFKVTDEQIRASLSDSYKVRPYIIRLINCKNIMVRDVTIMNSPMWVQHYLACSHVNIDGITVISRVNHNNDGIDIDGCDNVRISDCNIQSGDDAIVLKSTLDRICRNVTVTNCTLLSDCNAFKLGTESNGGFQNINFSNSTIYNTRLAGIALEMVDGGKLENVIVSGINMDSVGCAIFVRLGNRARPFKENMPKPGMGQLSNVLISGVQATRIGKTGCSVTGLPSFPAKDITLENIRILFTGGGSKELADRNIEEFPEKYPEFRMFGDLPAYGFYCRHATGMIMENINLSFQATEDRPALFLDDISNSRISDITAMAGNNTEAFMVIDNCRNLIVRNCESSLLKGYLIRVRNGSKSIAFVDNSFLKRNRIKRDNSVNKSEVVVK